MALQGDVGVGGVDLASLTVTGATISLQDVTTTGIQSYTGTTTFNSVYVTAGNDFTVTGAVALGSASSVTTGGTGGNILITGTVNGAQALTLNAGVNAGDVALQGVVGGVTPLTNLTVTAKNISVGRVR